MATLIAASSTITTVAPMPTPPSLPRDGVPLPPTQPDWGLPSWRIELDLVTCSFSAHRSTLRQLSCLFLRLGDKRRSAAVSSTELLVAVSCSWGGWGVSCLLGIASADWVIVVVCIIFISLVSCGARDRRGDDEGDRGFFVAPSRSTVRLSGSGFSVISNDLDASRGEECGLGIELLQLISEYSGTESRHAAERPVEALCCCGIPENLSTVEICENFASEELNCDIDFFWVSHKFSIFFSESSFWGSELISFEMRLFCDCALRIPPDKRGLLEAEGELWNRRRGLVLLDSEVFVLSDLRGNSSILLEASITEKEWRLLSWFCLRVSMLYLRRAATGEPRQLLRVCCATLVAMRCEKCMRLLRIIDLRL